MTSELSKNFHGVGIGPLSKILAVKSNTTLVKRYVDFRAIKNECFPNLKKSVFSFTGQFFDISTGFRFSKMQ